MGIYAFYDFDGAAIYVGQTYEKLGGRIGRHLTNKRTDAVAMRVLDPMEVAEIEVWPFWDLQKQPDGMPKKAWIAQVKATINAAEYTVYSQLKAQLGDISDLLNEKLPPATASIILPKSYRASIVPKHSRDRLYHPDERIARRASTIAALALVVKERDVSIGLRRTLVTQAERLYRLAATRYDEIVGKVPSDELERDTIGDEVDAADADIDEDDS